MINPYFNLHKTNSEQNLIENLIVEAIRIHGVDIVYLPRDLQKEDLILGEDILSNFTKTYEFEVYIKSVDQFGGQGDFMSKFGLQIEDTLNLQVANVVFQNASNQEIAKPREGDLIFFPFNKMLFEIKFVEHEEIFYQLGRLYVYDLRCQKFTYTNEVIETGDPDIDDYIDTLTYSINLELGTGTGNYTIGEFVTQADGPPGVLCAGEVVSWNSTTKILQLKNITGTFESLRANIIGNISNASYTLVNVDMKDNVNETRDSNTAIEVEATDGEIVNFDEDNIFGKF